MSKFKIFHSIFFIFFLIIFRVVLDFSYVNFVVPIYTYEGYIYDFKKINYTASWLMYILSFFFVKDRLVQPSDYFFVTALLSVYAPLTSYYGLSGLSVYPVAITLISFYLVYFFTKTNAIKPFKFRSFQKGTKFSFSLSVFSILVLIFWYFISGAVSYFNLDFTKVYEFRSLSSEVATIGFMAYFNGWVYNVFIVYAIAYTLLYKKYYLTLILILTQVFFYGVSNHKTVFFTPIIVLSIWWYFRKYSSVFFMVVSFSSIILVSTLLYFTYGDIVSGSLFIRRVFFVPARLTYQYFDFFSQYENIYWSNSVLSWLLDYPYDDRMTKIVSYEYGSNASANNGYVSSGFAHFGVWGVIIYSFIIGLFLKNIDNVFKYGVPLWFILCLIVTPMRSFLISSDLPTGLLTHGFILAFILLILTKDYNRES